MSMAASSSPSSLPPDFVYVTTCDVDDREVKNDATGEMDTDACSGVPRVDALGAGGIYPETCDDGGREVERDVTGEMDTDARSGVPATDPLGAGGIYPNLGQFHTEQPAQMQAASAPFPEPPKEGPPQPPQRTNTKTKPPKPKPIQHERFLQPSDPMDISPQGAKPELAPEEGREYRVLIIGKTGNGKSSLANTITGAKNFPVGRGMFSTTLEAGSVTADVQGRRLKVIDTPDVTNLRVDTERASQHVQRWKQLAHPVPDVIILAVRCDVRYTKEEHAIYLEIQNLWGDLSLFRQRLMVAFTFGDRQDEDLGEELETVCEELKSVLGDARHRYVQVNNRARGEEEKARQLGAICDMLNQVITQNERSAELPMDTDKEVKELAVVILGKTGHGKSSVGNLITGRNSFTVGTGLSPVTTDVSKVIVPVERKRLTVIDTPDFSHLNPAQKQRQIEKLKELTSSLPVVILWVVRCDVRFTSDDLTVRKDIREMWGSDPSFLIVVFTFSDRKDYVLEEQIKTCRHLSSIIGGADKPWIEVNKKASAVEKQDAVNKLLSLIDGQGEATKRTLASATQDDQSTTSAVSQFFGKQRTDTTDPEETTTPCYPRSTEGHAADAWACAVV